MMRMLIISIALMVVACEDGECRDDCDEVYEECQEDARNGEESCYEGYAGAEASAVCSTMGNWCLTMANYCDAACEDG